jgi:hypothetical protein
MYKIQLETCLNLEVLFFRLLFTRRYYAKLFKIWAVWQEQLWELWIPCEQEIWSRPSISLLQDFDAENTGILQVGSLMQGWQPCSVKKITVAKSREVKTGWSKLRRNKQVWQNRLMQAMAQKRLFCQWWWRNTGVSYHSSFQWPSLGKVI